jgi:hypothetical protein
MSPSPVIEVFSRATRLALRAGASEIDIDILLMAIDFESGFAQPPDLSEINALLAQYASAGVDDPAVQSPGECFGGYTTPSGLGCRMRCRPRSLLSEALKF